MWDQFKAYYREKRIRRILSFYHSQQPHNFTLRAHTRVPVFSRDARIQFVLTCLGFLIFYPSIATLKFPYGLTWILAGFLAVESADFLVIRGSKILDRVFDFVIPVIMLVSIPAFYFGEKHYGIIGKQRAKFQEFRTQKNEELQKKPIPGISDVESGENWILLGFQNGSMSPLTLPEAENLCHSRGPDWQLFDGSFTFDPPLVLNRSWYFWVRGMKGQIGPGEPHRPNSWVSSNGTERALALCVRKN